MKKKPEKLPAISSEHKEALAKLRALPEFKAFLDLVRIEEHNIVYSTFKINSSNPDLPRLKAWEEGRIYELKKIIKTFDECYEKDDE